MGMGDEQFVASFSVTIRLCRAEDLRELEWFGSFRDHRDIIERTFEAMQRGEQLMWVADRRGFPAGQVWLDLARGRLWAARVFWPLQGLGIGKRLTLVAERALWARQGRRASVTVQPGNTRAWRFWTGEGYRPAGRVVERWRYRTPDGVYVEAAEEQDLLEKALGDDLGHEVPEGGNDARRAVDDR
jgi:GNAT superfamily N-acetyltransferase